MDDFKMDWERIARTGTSEAVLCEPKSAHQIDAIVEHARALGHRLLLTRLDRAKLEQLADPVRQALDYDAVSRTAFLGSPPSSSTSARIAIVVRRHVGRTGCRGSGAHARIRRRIRVALRRRGRGRTVAARAAS